jgi:hypothetical protein
MYDFNTHIFVYITGNKRILIIVGNISLKNAIQNLSYGDYF